MVRGFESFQNWFKGYENQYAIIGGTACDILMAREGLAFRATKDVDLVLIVEAMTVEFGDRFWQYIQSGGYEFRYKSSSVPHFYRFSRPKADGYPVLIELFSRKIDSIHLPEDAVLTPFPIGEDVSSLSAILLDENYYQFLRTGTIVINGISILSALHLIAFKAKAWLDLSARKAAGEQVDSRNIRKHKNDIFRLTELLMRNQKISTPQAIIHDLTQFVELMQNEEIDLEQLGIVGKTKQQLLTEMLQLYESKVDA